MADITRILCPLDLSEPSRHALDHALAFAKWYEAQVTVLHVYGTPQPIMPVTDTTATVPFSPSLPLEEVIDDVQRFCAPALTAEDPSPDSVVKEGNPAAEIAAYGAQLPADLLVMGTHGRSGLERLLLGSVTEKVLRMTDVPVLTVPPSVERAGPVLYKTILCPIEFSGASTRALEYALSLVAETTRVSSCCTSSKA
jgi:nucleotide-binding universal stress UspA family protein